MKEEIKWKRKILLQMIEGDRNRKFFHGLASSRSRINRICYLMDGEDGLKDHEAIIEHVKEYFSSHYSKEEWEQPRLSKLDFASIGNDQIQWLERNHEEEEVHQAVFPLVVIKPKVQMDFPWLSFKDCRMRQKMTF